MMRSQDETRGDSSAKNARPLHPRATEADEQTIDVEATAGLPDPSSGGVSGMLGPSYQPGSADTSYRLGSGRTFGPYIIIRPLGRGGMGEVYEAVHSVSRHRLAIKILPSELAWSQERRKRFQREGQTAASVNHPHSLYVFGTSEIDSTPVIAMELASGGTLSDRVNRDGPMPVKAAVDAVLQLAEGLEAAAAAGVLHRDVKPANCFIDQSGSVKIGDYGLSLPVEAEESTQLTQDGSSPMTPAYASPEQMLGQSLDVRADIYSLGATLYNLLTGQTPYVAGNLVAMIASVMGSSPKSPSSMRPEISAGLSRVILRCLEKKPENRYPDYAALRMALLPFSSEQREEAGLRGRVAAGFVDVLSTSALSMGLAPLMVTRPGLEAMLESILWILLSGLMEGMAGGTPGKLLCGMRTLARTGGRPGLLRGLVRAALFGSVPTAVTFYSELTRGATNTAFRDWAEILIWVPVVGILFLPVILRRSGGPLHDRLSGTRVVRDQRPERAPASVRHAPSAALRSLPEFWQIGPFRIGIDTETAAPGVIIEGFDDTLRRSVWIRFSEPDAPWISESRRNLQRATRLRWVDGRRGGTLGWDAFENVPGGPLASRLTEGEVPWDPAGTWLFDVASELQAIRTDGGDVPHLALDRVWITESDRAVLLDFAPPPSERGASSAPIGSEVSSSPTAEEFMRELLLLCTGQVRHPASRGGRDRRQAPWPLAVGCALSRWTDSASRGKEPEALQGLTRDLQILRRRPGLVTRRQRASQFSLVVGPIIALSVVGSYAGKSEVARGYESGHRTARSHTQMRNRLRTLVAPQPSPQDSAATRYRRASGIYFRQVLHAAPDSIPKELLSTSRPRERTVLDSLRREQPPDSSEVAWANAEFDRLNKVATKPEPTRWLLVALIGGLIFSVFAGILSLLTGGGPLLRTLGMAVVRTDGRPASRRALLARSVVTWSPFLIGLGLLALLRHHAAEPLATIVPGILLVAGSVYAVIHPERSIQDRCARTWLVPL